MVYGRYNELVNGVYTPTFTLLAPSCILPGDSLNGGLKPHNMSMMGSHTSIAVGYMIHLNTNWKLNNSILKLEIKSSIMIQDRIIHLLMPYACITLITYYMYSMIFHVSHMTLYNDETSPFQIGKLKKHNRSTDFPKKQGSGIPMMGEPVRTNYPLVMTNSLLLKIDHL